MDLQLFSLILMGMITLIIVYVILGNLLEHKHIHLIHETGIGIIIGLIFGLILYIANNLNNVQFNEEVFFVGLLPPMIFAGGYNLKKKDFGKNIRYIILYGLLGTLTSFGVIFGLTYAINKLEWIVILRDSATIYLSIGLIIKFSATISATDSVAALTLIKAQQFPKLFSIIFGEGMVNDAVAIILFKVVGGIFDEQHHSDDGTLTTLLNILGSFLSTIIFSLLIGIASALLCSFIFRKMRFLVENQVPQVVLTYMFGILSYVIAEYFNMSGVITVLVSGVCLAHYNFYNLSVGGMHATAVTFQSISFIAQSIVFVYLGISTIHYFVKQDISFSFLFLELIICFISRLAAIFGLSLIYQLFTKKWTVSSRELAIISIAGTIRGSVAFALILTIQQDPEHEDPAVSLIKSTTLIMVCLTTIVLGALMPQFIKFFLGGQTKTNPLQQKIQNHQPLIPKKNKKPNIFKTCDEQYWKPFFIYQYKDRKEQINRLKKLMKFNSRGQYQGGNFNALVIAGSRNSVLDDFVDKVEKKDEEHKLKSLMTESNLTQQE